LSTAAASGVDVSAPGAGADMIEVIDSTRSGWSMAMRWTIIPPMETPAMCACSTPAASSTAMASSAMSAST
jgi:hypothetical protein